VTHDPINNPSHYAEGRQYEPIAVIEDWQLNYRLGNAVKYVSRAGRKQNAIEDLRKAVWYIEREIETLEGARSPYSVTYKDVLENAAYEAANGSVPLYEYSVNVPQVDVDEEPLPFWDSDEDYMWDPTLGPVDLTEAEVNEILAKKDLNMFDPDEIVSVVEKRGFLLGIKKDGSTCELGANGRCI
jgi:hypothetical protein